MKTIFKILVILIVVVLVGGLFYGAVTATSSGTDRLSMPERPADREIPADGGLVPPDREGAGGIQFPADAIKNLVIISVVSVIYLNAIKWLGRKKPAVKVTP
jgi:hypothetical protein